jgi:hypothetical protein
MHDLKMLQPKAFESKTRLGNDYDGGYVLLSEQVERTEVLLSFGVATDWSFEADFFRRRKGLVVRMFDACTSFPLIVANFFSKLAQLDFTRASHYLRAGAGYVSFILLNGRVRLSRRFLGLKASDRDVTFEQVIDGLGGTPPESSGIFVKLDVEGAEYDLLPVILGYERLINGIAVEFHHLDTKWEKFEETVKLACTQFVVAHVHGNNYEELVPGTRVPKSLEVTFVNRRIVGSEPAPDPDSYPRPGLDYPNDPARADYPLVF